MIDTAKDRRLYDATLYQDDPAVIAKEAFAVLMPKKERPGPGAGVKAGPRTRRQEAVRRPRS